MQKNGSQTLLQAVFTQHKYAALLITVNAPRIICRSSGSGVLVHAAFPVPQWRCLHRLFRYSGGPAQDLHLLPFSSVPSRGEVGTYYAE